MDLLKHLRMLSPAFLILTLACEQTVIKPAGSDFFPLSDQHEWHYQQRLAIEGDTPDTLSLRVEGEIEIEDQTYKIIAAKEGNTYKVVRKEESKYFGRNHELYSGFSHEYMFLDTDKTVGESWSYLKDEGQTKTEYVIAAKNASRTVLDKVYKDVIEVQVNYYIRDTPGGELILWKTAVHFYANGVGEIYSYYPSHINGMYVDFTLSIMHE